MSRDSVATRFAKSVPSPTSCVRCGHGLELFVCVSSEGIFIHRKAVRWVLAVEVGLVAALPELAKLLVHGLSR
jgi:hypothetical protein